MEKAPVIEREKLKKWVDEKKTFALVHVLGQGSYEVRHLPGAVQAGVHEDGFLEKIAMFVSDKDKLIVVYCSGFQCQASPLAAKKLIGEGYTNVYHYAGGLADWQDAGYTFEEEGAKGNTQLKKYLLRALLILGAIVAAPLYVYINTLPYTL